MVWRLVLGRFFVLFHNAEPPEEPVWNAYLAEFARHVGKLAGVRTLVVTEGGSPSTEQRIKLNHVMAYESTPTAIVSDAALALEVARMLNTFNAQMRVYAPERLEEAFHHLGVKPSEREEVLAQLDEMRAAVGSRMRLS